MKYDKNKKQYLFENDDEFFDFAIVPELKLNYSDKGTPYADWEFSEAYNNAIKNGDSFCINDEDSKILKRGVLTYRTIGHQVENLIQDND